MDGDGAHLVGYTRGELERRRIEVRKLLEAIGAEDLQKKKRSRWESDSEDSDDDGTKFGKGTSAKVRRVEGQEAGSVAKRDVFEKYEVVSRVGEGTFGEVLKCKVPMGSERIFGGPFVAIKCLKDSAEALNEVTIMSDLKLLDCPHPNVVRVIEFQEFQQARRMCIVMEFVPFDLTVLMEAAGGSLQCGEIKCITHQVVEALAFLHGKRVIHRDVKPSNILYDGAGRVRLCDFGLAKELPPSFSFGGASPSSSSRPMTPGTTTRYYRAPELLLGATHYGPEIDMWSLGCLFGELVRNRVTFPGSSEIDQMGKIFGVLGSPTLESWPQITALPGSKNLRLQGNPSLLSQVFPLVDITPPGFDFIQKLLRYNSATRMSAAEALRHDYFAARPGICDFQKMPKLVEDDP